MGFTSSLSRGALWLALLSHANARVVTWPIDGDDNETSLNTALEPRALLPRADDPTSFAWVRKLVAIGDSYTAGIGSGNQLGDLLDDDWLCSRYDYS